MYDNWRPEISPFVFQDLPFLLYLMQSYSYCHFFLNKTNKSRCSYLHLQLHCLKDIYAVSLRLWTFTSFLKCFIEAITGWPMWSLCAGMTNTLWLWLIFIDISRVYLSCIPSASYCTGKILFPSQFLMNIRFTCVATESSFIYAYVS